MIFIKQLIYLFAVLFGAWIVACQFYLQSWLGDLFNNFRQQYIVLFALLGFVSLLMKDRYFSIVFILLALYLFLLNFSQITSVQSSNNLPNNYTLTTFNVFARNQNQQLIIEKIKSINSDIIVLQEVSSHLYQQLKKLKGQYPFRLIDNTTLREHVVIMSRYRIRNINLAPAVFPNKKNSILQANCYLPGGVIRVIGVHFTNPLRRRNFIKRATEFSGLERLISRSADATIVAGDFNTTPWSAYMQNLLKFTGLHLYNGRYLYQPTWQRNNPLIMIPIDHILSGALFKVKQHRVDRDNAGSDHYPVTLVFNYVSRSTANAVD